MEKRKGTQWSTMMQVLQAALIVVTVVGKKVDEATFTSENIRAIALSVVKLCFRKGIS